MSEDTRTFLKIINDDLNACADGSKINVWNTLQDCWDFAPVGRSGDGDATMWWWIDSFIESRDERYRIQRALFGVDMFFANLSKLVGGIIVPRRFKDALKRQILQAMFPSAREVVACATSHNALRAQRNLYRFFAPAEWRKRSWDGK